MSNVIARPFSFFRDFRSIAWGATLSYNVLRSACAGLVWSILFLVMATQAPRGEGVPPGIALTLPIFWPIMFFFIWFPLSIVIGFLADAHPALGILGLVTLFYAFMFVTVGDPLVCVIKRLAPQLVPVERPPLLSLRAVYYVLKSEDTTDFAISH